MAVEEDQLQLSEHALLALQSFLDEKAEMDRRMSELIHKADEDFQASKDSDALLSMDLFKEDWNLSQFWYSDETADILAAFLESNRGSACCISAPTAFIRYKKRKQERNLSQNGKCHLLEYDTRFRVFGKQFIHYDYKQPLEVSPLLAKSCDTILADPPFLSEECLLKTCMTIKHLAADGARIMICTGAVMKDFLARIMPDMRECVNFQPKHTSGLSNEFRCFTNFDLSQLEIISENPQ